MADALLIHESTVRQHLNDYVVLSKLKPESNKATLEGDARKIKEQRLL